MTGVGITTGAVTWIWNQRKHHLKSGFWWTDVTEQKNKDRLEKDSGWYTTGKTKTHKRKISTAAVANGYSICLRKKAGDLQIISEYSSKVSRISYYLILSVQILAGIFLLLFLNFLLLRVRVYVTKIDLAKNRQTINRLIKNVLNMQNKLGKMTHSLSVELLKLRGFVTQFLLMAINSDGPRSRCRCLSNMLGLN